MIRPVLSLLCLFLLIAPTANSQTKPHNDWTTLQRIALGERVAVELKTGKTIKGAFDTSTDTILIISVHGNKQTIDRNDVKKVHRISEGSIGMTTLKGTGIGAATGATVGAGLGDRCDKPTFGPCFSRGEVAAVGAVLFAIPGTIVGLVIGLHRHHRELIYES